MGRQQLPSTSEEQARLADRLEAQLGEEPEQVLRQLRAIDAAQLRAGPLGLVHGLALREVEGVHAALAWLTELAEVQPDEPDVWHALGRCYEELGDQRSAARCYRRVRSLDAWLDEQAGFEEAAENERVLRVAKRVVEALPVRFRELLEPIPLVIEPRPGPELVAQGFDPRSLGCFEGPTHSDHLVGAGPQLTCIVLYSANLTAAVPADDDDALQREIEITVLHEIGHFFDLDDARLEQLGLG